MRCFSVVGNCWNNSYLYIPHKRTSNSVILNSPDTIALVCTLTSAPRTSPAPRQRLSSVVVSRRQYCATRCAHVLRLALSSRTNTSESGLHSIQSVLHFYLALDHLRDHWSRTEHGAPSDQLTLVTAERCENRARQIRAHLVRCRLHCPCLIRLLSRQSVLRYHDV